MEEFDIGYPHANVKRVVTKGFRTIRNRIIASRLDKDYYDGKRANGYGGFYYDGRWAKIVPGIIKRYGLTSSSTVLDLGCKKGFFLHDLKNSLPGISIKGVENHSYPLEHAMGPVKQDLTCCDYTDLPFKAGTFDFVMGYASIYMLNLKGVIKTLREIQRVGKGKSYITLGAYETEEERELFRDWTLIGTTVLHKTEWLEVFKEAKYTGDYGFTTASTLQLTRP